MSYLKDSNNLYPLPKEQIQFMKAYEAPLEKRRNLLRLDFNENTLGPSPKVYEAIQNIQSYEISIYPEYDLLKNDVCVKYLNNKTFNPNEIGIFNGADAAINAAFNAFGLKDEKFLTTEPTFGYYFPCAAMQGMDAITCGYLGESFEFPFKDFEDKIKKYSPRLVFICNPNNPTGTILSAEKILYLASKYKKSLFVIDELYEKFYGDSLLNYINFEERRNIIIIQSLSKTAGLAGLRIGFAFGNKILIDYLNKVTGPYDVNGFAVTAAIAAIDDKAYIDNYVLKVKEAREWIKNKFESINVRSHFSGGNYFLIWPNTDPTLLEQRMRKKGILIRNMQNKRSIEKSIRISIGIKEQMQSFWEIYKDLDIKNNLIL